jgi:hypothetical protein
MNSDAQEGTLSIMGRWKESVAVAAWLIFVDFTEHFGASLDSAMYRSIRPSG